MSISIHKLNYSFVANKKLLAVEYPVLRIKKYPRGSQGVKIPEILNKMHF
jgi:hypothetical protein